MDSNECIICGKNCVTEDCGDGIIEIGSAVHFMSYGNWASGVWDPLDEHLTLNIYICDECLKERMIRATVVSHEYEGWKEVYRKRFDQWEHKDRNDKWSFSCACGGEMLVKNVGIDSVPICTKCGRRGPKMVRADHKKGLLP
jgi:hypothetical protein